MKSYYQIYANIYHYSYIVMVYILYVYRVWHLTLNLSAGGADGLEASSVSSWFSSSRSLLEAEKGTMHRNVSEDTV